MANKAVFFLLILSSLFSILVSPTSASGLTVFPAHQEILASGSAVITYQNQTADPITLHFSLQKIIATDLLGRLQFNAPLPQTLQNTDPELAEINPNELTIQPGESATVSAQFNPEKLNPGTNAFLLLGKLNQATQANQSGTALEQYLGSSILVTALGGHQTKLELVAASLSSIHIHFSHHDFIQLTLRNTGNTRSIPRGVVATADLFGREIMRGAVNGDSVAILPGSQRLIYARLQPALTSWPINIHTLKITGSDDVSRSQFNYQKTYLFIHPYLLPAAALIFTIILIIKKKQKTR